MRAIPTLAQRGKSTAKTTLQVWEGGFSLLMTESVRGIQPGVGITAAPRACNSFAVLCSSKICIWMKYRWFAHFSVYTPHLKRDGCCKWYVSKFSEVFLKAVKSTNNPNPALNICWQKKKKKRSCLKNPQARLNDRVGLESILMISHEAKCLKKQNILTDT